MPRRNTDRAAHIRGRLRAGIFRPRGLTSVIGILALFLIQGFSAGATGKTPSASKKNSDAEVLTNLDVIKLTSSGLGDAVVISKINSVAKEKLDASTDGLLQLKQAGVSPAVIQAVIARAGHGPMQQRGSPTGTPAPPAPASSAATSTPPPNDAGGPPAGTSSTAAAPSPAKEHECIEDFQTKGGYFAGERITASHVYNLSSSVSKAALFDRLLQSVAGHGWQVTNSAKDSGLISASRPIAIIGANHQSNVNLNIFVKDGEAGTLRADATVAVPSGTKVTDKEAKNELCQMFQGAL